MRAQVRWSMSCPGCGATIEIPQPSERALESALPKIPFPLPGLSVGEYELAFQETMKIVDVTSKLCDYCGRPEMRTTVVDDAIAALGSLNAFVTHALQAETGRDGDRDTPFTDGIREFAAGSDFAGIGTAKAKRRQYERWENGLEPAKFVRPDSDLLGLIQDSIRRLREL